MPRRILSALCATLGLALLLAPNVGAVRYLDNSARIERGEETCFDLDDLRRFNIQFESQGMLAELANEADLVEYFVKLYGCTLLHNRWLRYGRQGAVTSFYLISVNNLRQDGTFRTLPDLLKITGQAPVYLSNPPQLFPSLALARASENFRRLARSTPPDQLFFEGLDYLHLRYLGLFDETGGPIRLPGR